MKKILFLTALLVASVAMYANTEETNDDTKASKNTTLCHPENFSHWSIAVGGGANLMLGENTNYKINYFGTYLKENANWAVKGEIEYMVNPVWGLNLHYMYAPFSKKCAQNNGMDVDKDLQMHETSLQFVVNVLNLGRRTRTHTNWNWYIGAGIGVLCYQREDQSIRPAWMVPATMSVEYSPIPALGIFAEGQFRWFADDRINGVSGGEMKDCGLYGGLGLRYHIGTSKKDHVRVTDCNTYEPLVVANVSTSSTNDTEIKALQAQIDNLTAQLKQVNQTPAPATNAQAAPQMSDDEINKKVNDAVNAATAGVKEDVKTLDNRVTALENGEYYTGADATVFFAFNSAVVTPDYQTIVAKVAERMNKNANEKILISGYCDASGSEELNKALAQRRIDAVIDLLVNRYKIARNRISTECIGRVKERSSDDALDRRCDINFK